MRLWIVNHYAAPPGATGGPSRHVGLARVLRDRGHEIVIHASLYDHYTRTDRHRCEDGLPVVERIEGITYVWWPTPPYSTTRQRIRNMATFAWSVARRARKLDLPPPDVVIGSSPHLLSGWTARRLARRFRVPFIFEVRDLWPQTFVDLGELGPHHPATLLLRYLERSLYRTAATIVAVPPVAAAYIVSRGADPANVVHIPNGVDLNALARPTEADPPDEDAATTVLYAGTMGRANGLDLAIDAWEELVRRGRHDIRLRLVGPGPERDALRARATSRPELRVSVEDAVPSDQVPELLASADLCLLMLRPSPVFHWGVSPTKLFEYLAAGKPVVASVTAPDTIVGPAGAGAWVAAGDAAALADAIESLADKPREELLAMGQRGRAFVESHHGFESLATQLEDALALALVSVR